MAGSVNKVILIGNLGRDPEVRSFQNGGKVCNLRIATSETWRDRNTGERKERTEWHSVAIFQEGLVKVAEQYLRKGSKVYIEGQLQTRKWQDQSGQDRYTTEIIADEGHIGMIEGDGPLDFGAPEYGRLFQKAASLHFELMFVRARRDAANMIRQHEILEAVSALVDAGTLKTTMTRRLSPIRAATLREAHTAVESGSMIGKIVVAGWPEETPPPA